MFFLQLKIPNYKSTIIFRCGTCSEKRQIMSFIQSNFPKQWYTYCIIIYVNKKQLQCKGNAALVHAWDEIKKYVYFVIPVGLSQAGQSQPKGPGPIYHMVIKWLNNLQFGFYVLRERYKEGFLLHLQRWQYQALYVTEDEGEVKKWEAQ